MGNGLDPASQQILMDPRWEGKVSAIAWFTGLIDKYVVMFISLIGFLIILSTMLRNVLAALYYSNPKFWNRIDMIKSAESGGGSGKANYSTIERILARLPNLRDWIDIDETTGDPKDYLIKAIPQAIIGTFIGVLIFSSYYRKLIANVAGLGLHVFDKYFLSRNLVADFDAIVDEGTDYKFTYGNSEGGKKKTKIARKVYDAVRSNYGNIREAETKQLVGTNIENTLTNNLFNGLSQYLDDPKWIMSFEVENKGSVQPTQPMTVNTQMFQEHWKVFRMGDLTGSKTTDNDKDNNYLVVFITFKLNEMQVTSQTEFTLTADVNVMNGEEKEGRYWLYKIPPGKEGIAGSGIYRGPNGLYEIKANGQNLEVKPLNEQQQPIMIDKNLTKAPSGQLTSASGAMINYGSSGASISQINFSVGSSTSIKLTVNSGNGSIPDNFVYGESLTIKKTQKEENNTTPKSQGNTDPIVTQP